MNSVVQTERECYICKTQRGLQRHHIYGGPNRNWSERNGYVIYLCLEHHTGNTGVHMNREADLMVKRMAQMHYEAHHGTREDFIKEVGKSYILAP